MSCRRRRLGCIPPADPIAEERARDGIVPNSGGLRSGGARDWQFGEFSPSLPFKKASTAVAERPRAAFGVDAYDGLASARLAAAVVCQAAHVVIGFPLRRLQHAGFALVG